MEDRKIYVITDWLKFGFSFGFVAATGAAALITLGKLVEYVLSLF